MTAIVRKTRGGSLYYPEQQPPDRVPLRNRETGDVRSYYTVDAREILAQPQSQYEPVDDAGRRFVPRREVQNGAQKEASDDA